MTPLLVTMIAAATLAFGAVYPWGYWPLFGVAALIGLAGLRRGGIPRDRRPLALACLAVLTAIAIQVVPLPRSMLESLSPATIVIQRAYNLAFPADAAGWATLSIAPGQTYVSAAGFGALSLYLLGLPSLLNNQSVRALPRALALFAVPLALFAISTRQYNNGLLYGFWRSVDGGGPDQAGPFINRNHFAGWMLMTVCLMVGLLCGQVERALAAGTRRHRRTITRIVGEDAGAILLTATAVALMAVSIFWVISRSAISSFTLAIGAIAWLVATRRRLSTPQRGLVVVILGTVLLAAIGWRGADVLWRWFLDDRTLVSRLDAWRDGWAVVRDFPLFGAGLNTYSSAMLFYQTRNPGVHMAQAHNDYLQLLAEGGLIVAVPAALAVLLLGRAIRRSLHAARGEGRGYWIRAGAAVGLLAIACQEAVEFSLQIPANAVLFCTLAALALTPTATSAAPADVMARVNIPLPEDRPGAALS